MKVPGTTIVKVTNSKINGLNAKNNTTERTKRTHELLPHVQGQESLLAKSTKNPHMRADLKTIQLTLLSFTGLLLLINQTVRIDATY